MSEPWSLLETGDRFSIVSYSGKKYDAVFLLAGEQEAGLYVRLQDKKIARFSPARLIWTSLEKTGSGGEVLFPGDDVLVQRKGGGEVLGKLSAVEADRISVKPARGEVVALSAENAIEGSFRLLFPASDLRAGDEFLVRSASGREYRGRATAVERERVTAVLVAGGDPVAIRVENLDLRSLYVLIRLPLFAATSTPRH